MSEVNKSESDRRAAIKTIVAFGMAFGRHSNPVEVVLKNRLRGLELLQRERDVISTLTDSVKNNDRVGILVSQSELTAIKTVQEQVRMKEEKDRTLPHYESSELAVERALGPKVNDLDELRVVTREIIWEFRE